METNNAAHMETDNAKQIGESVSRASLCPYNYRCGDEKSERHPPYQILPPTSDILHSPFSSGSAPCLSYKDKQL